MQFSPHRGGRGEHRRHHLASHQERRRTRPTHATESRTRKLLAPALGSERTCFISDGQQQNSVHLHHGVRERHQTRRPASSSSRSGGSIQHSDTQPTPRAWQTHEQHRHADHALRAPANTTAHGTHATANEPHPATGGVETATATRTQTPAAATVSRIQHRRPPTQTAARIHQLPPPAHQRQRQHVDL